MAFCGLPEYQLEKLPSAAIQQLKLLYDCRELYPQKELPDYKLVYSACKTKEGWRVVTDCNLAFDLGGITFYPHRCDNRPQLAERLAKSVCFWLNLRGGYKI